MGLSHKYFKKMKLEVLKTTFQLSNFDGDILRDRNWIPSPLTMKNQQEKN